MTYIRPTPARRGRLLKARRVNYDEAGVRQAQIVSGEGVLVSQGITGTSISIDPGIAPPTTFWIELTAIGTGLQVGLYAWKKIRGKSTSLAPYDWVDATGSGTTGTLDDDPAIEANLCGTLAVGTRCEVRREAVTNQIRFQLETCLGGATQTVLTTQAWNGSTWNAPP